MANPPAFSPGLPNMSSDSGPMHPAGFAVAVSPSDTVALDFITRGIYVGGTGDLTIVPYGGVLAGPVTFKNVQAGSLLPLKASYIMNTGTTATFIVAVQ